MNIVIFGSGNVAWSLGHAFTLSGHQVLKVISRNSSSGLKLANEIFSDFQLLYDVDFIFPENTICILCFPDDVLRKIALTLKIDNCIVIHTAGSVSINALKGISDRIGVFYPLQSLKYGTMNSNKYPLLIDASDSDTLQILKSLANTISNKVCVADDFEREKMHLAAVIVNNFVNHLFTLTFDFCKSQDMDFNFLLPLIQETVSRVENNIPSEVQTGPAIRSDQNTINRHLQLMQNKNEIELRNFYMIFSDSIQKYYKLKKNQ